MAKTICNPIVEDGPWRLRRGRREGYPDVLQKKYEAELARANPDEKRKIYDRMQEELQRRAKMSGHNPSAGTLW